MNNNIETVPVKREVDHAKTARLRVIRANSAMHFFVHLGTQNGTFICSGGKLRDHVTCHVCARRIDPADRRIKRMNGAMRYRGRFPVRQKCVRLA